MGREGMGELLSSLPNQLSGELPLIIWPGGLKDLSTHGSVGIAYLVACLGVTESFLLHHEPASFYYFEVRVGGW